MEMPATVDQAPLLATNMRGEFLLAGISKTRGVANYSFCKCLIQDETLLLNSLYRTLTNYSNSWNTRCVSLSEAIQRMAARGSPASKVVLPLNYLSLVGLGQTAIEAETLMKRQGFVDTVYGIPVLSINLPGKGGFVLPPTSLAGVYTRVDDCVGLLVNSADNISLIGP